jgi:hypothetical protein
VLTLSVSGPGSGTLTVNGEPFSEFPEAWILDLGTQVVISVESAVGSIFEGWTGGVIDTSETIVFTVEADTQIDAQFGLMSGPPILEQSASRTVLAGQNASLSVAAAGEGLSYQWFAGSSGDDSSPIEGATDSEYLIESIIETASFWVRVTGADGEFTDSVTILLTVPEAVGLDAWTDIESGNSDTLYGVVWGNDRFVAVGANGSILTSSDGRIWSNQISTVTTALNGVAYGGGTFVAVGIGGTILTSSNGTSWTPRSSGTSSTLSAVAHGPHGFVAVGSSGVILSSSDGVTWTSQDSKRTGFFRAVTWNGEVYVAVGDRQFTSSQFGSFYSPTLVTSPDGETWTVRSAPSENYRTVIGHDGKTLVGGLGGLLLHSLTGFAWEEWPSGLSSTLSGSLWTGNEFLLVSGGTTVLSSTDGLRWKTHDTGIFAILNSAANNEEIIVLVGSRILLSVLSEEPAPAILQDPASQTVEVGSTVTLSVDALGDVLSYQWYQGERGDTSNPIAGANQATFETPSVNVETAYWVSVTGSSGQVSVSEAATITPLEVERDLYWRWLHPLPAGIAYYGLIHSPSGYIAVGASGTIGLSTDAEAWEMIASPTSQDLHAVIWTGQVYLAVGAEGIILSSADGRYWQKHFSGTTTDLQDVTWDGTQFVVVGSKGITLISEDGIAWERNDLSTAQDFYGVSHNGSRFVAVGQSGILYTSEDGRAWVSRSSETTRALYDILWDGQQFIAAGGAGTVLTSLDGITWSVGSAGTTRVIYKLALGGAGYLAVGSFGIILESADAIDWTELIQGASSLTHRDIIIRAEKTVVVGSGGSILVSSDMESWESLRQTNSSQFRQIAFGADRWVAVGNSNQILTTTGMDIPWESVEVGPENANYTSISHGPSGFVAVGNNGLIMTSMDGLTWFEASSPVSVSLSHVNWTGEFYLAVGGTGTILTSVNGIDWLVRESGTNTALNASASSASLHVVIGSSGTVLTSADGVEWSLMDTPTESFLRDIVYTGSGFVAHYTVANSSISGTTYSFRTLRSSDGFDWSTQIHFTGTAPINSLAWNGEYFLAGSSQGFVWTSSNATAWTQHENTPVTVVGIQWVNNQWLAVGSNGTILAAPDNRTAERPIIVEQPTSAQAEEGQTVELSIAATGSNLRYRWYRGETGDTRDPIESEFAATLTVTVDSEETSYWCRVSHGYGVSIDSATANVSPSLAVPTFAAWATAAGLAGEDALPQATPFGDGVQNLLKYAFNLDPSRNDRRILGAAGNHNAGLPSIAIEEQSEQKFLVLEFLRRRDSALLYTPQFSENLSNWVDADVYASVEVIDEEWERVTVLQPIEPTSGGRLFGRVEVTLPDAP